MPVTGFTDAVEINVEFFTLIDGKQYSFCKSFWANTLTLPAFLKEHLMPVNESGHTEDGITTEFIID